MGSFSLIVILLAVDSLSAVELTLPESCSSDQNIIEYLTVSLHMISPISKLINPEYGEAISIAAKTLEVATQIFGSSNDASINVWDCLQPHIEELAAKTAQKEITNYIDAIMKGSLDKIQRQMDIANVMCKNAQKCLKHIESIFDLVNSYSPNLFTDSEQYLALIGLNYLGAFSTLQYSLYRAYTDISINITGSSDSTMDTKFAAFLAQYLEVGYEWFPLLLTSLNDASLSYEERTDKLKLYWSMVPYCRWREWYLEMEGNEKYFKKYSWNEIMKPNCPDIMYQLISKKKEYMDPWITTNEFKTMRWGKWGQESVCDHSKSIHAFQHKLQQKPALDNTATNGIKLICNCDDQPVTSSTEGSGSWSEKYKCDKNGKITGYKLYAQSQVRGPFDCGNMDDWSVSGIAVICRDRYFNASVVESNLYKEVISCPMPTDQWTDFIECLPGYSVCGIQSRVEKHSDLIDNTALNNIKVKCCFNIDSIPNIGAYSFEQEDIMTNKMCINGKQGKDHGFFNINLYIVYVLIMISPFIYCLCHYPETKCWNVCGAACIGCSYSNRIMTRLHSVHPFQVIEECSDDSDSEKTVLSGNDV